MKKFDLIMENWREFKSLLNEKGTKPHQYPETFEKLRQEVAEEAQANKLYIFLDTETTGLDPQKRYSQITQIAAIKVNPHGFQEDTEIEIVDVFNKKVKLKEETIRQIENELENEQFWHSEPQKEKRLKKWQEEEPKRQEEFEDIEAINRQEAEESGQQYDPKSYTPQEYSESYTFRSILDNLKMTEYAPPDKLNPQGLRNLDPNEYLELKDALEQFVQFCSGDSVLIKPKLMAQNADFDIKYIENNAAREGIQTPDEYVFDSLQIFRDYLIPVIQQFKQKYESFESLPEEEKKILTSEPLTQEEKNLLNSLTLESFTTKTVTKVRKDTGKTVKIKTKVLSPKLSASLGKITAAFKIKNDKWHDALADVDMLAQSLKQVMLFLDKRPEMADIIYQRVVNERPEDIELEKQKVEFNKTVQPTKFVKGTYNRETGEGEYTEEYKDWLKTKERISPPRRGKPSTISENKIRIKIRR
jgi:DNA polymerase III epsilon subunit-like protein